MKLKTNKAIAKRIKLTKNGILRAKSCKNHRITGKGKTVREDKSGMPLAPGMEKKIRKMLPGISK